VCGLLVEQAVPTCPGHNPLTYSCDKTAPGAQTRTARAAATPRRAGRTCCSIRGTLRERVATPTGCGSDGMERRVLAAAGGGGKNLQLERRGEWEQAVRTPPPPPRRGRGSGRCRVTLVARVSICRAGQAQRPVRVGRRGWRRCTVVAEQGDVVITEVPLGVTASDVYTHLKQRIVTGPIRVRASCPAHRANPRPSSRSTTRASLGTESTSLVEPRPARASTRRCTGSARSGRSPSKSTASCPPRWATSSPAGNGAAAAACTPWQPCCEQPPVLSRPSRRPPSPATPNSGPRATGTTSAWRASRGPHVHQRVPRPQLRQRPVQLRARSTTPDTCSTNTFRHPAAVSSSVCRSADCSAIDTRAYPINDLGRQRSETLQRALFVAR